MVSIFIVKSDRVLLTRRFSDGLWQASCVGDGVPGDVLDRELGLRTRLVRCDDDVYRGVSSDHITTSHEIDEIEWVLIEDLPRFVSREPVDADLGRALEAFLVGIGSSVRLTL